MQKDKNLHETEIERIQSLMGVNVLNEQIGLNNLSAWGLSPGGLLSTKTALWMRTWDAHDWLTFVDVTAGLLGLIPYPPTAAVFLGISTAACLADGGLYFYQDDDYMAGLVLSFCLIPASELALMSPRMARSVAKGKKATLDTIKKGRELAKKRTLTEAEKAIVKEADELMSELSKNTAKIAKLTQKNFVTKFITNVITKGGKALFSTALLLSKMSWALGRPVLELGGVYYTFDEVYLAMYGSDKEKMKLRYNAGFQQLVRMMKLLTNQQSVDYQLAEYIYYNEEEIAKAIENTGNFVQIDYTKKQEYIDQLCQEETERLLKEQEEKIESPTLEQVLSKKIDPVTQQPYTIREGQKGDSVGKIQQMLEKLGYGDTLREYDENKKAVDYDFGKNTGDAVGLFQVDNSLKWSGIVDSETLKMMQMKLKQLENEKENIK